MGARRCVCTDALCVLSLCLHVAWLEMVGCGSPLPASGPALFCTPLKTRAEKAFHHAGPPPLAFSSLIFYSLRKVCLLARRNSSKEPSLFY